MPLAEAHIAPFLCGLAALALAFGVLAKLIALRLLFEWRTAANDSSYGCARAGTHRSRVRLSRTALTLVPQQRPATNDFPVLARQLPSKPRLVRVR